jgi:ABC-type branched-subunit amino acid transport system ATPase component
MGFYVRASSVDPVTTGLQGVDTDRLSALVVAIGGVLHEPSEGLTPVIVDELGETLVKLAAGDTSILLIEQNFSLVHRVAERYYVMSKGAVVEEGHLAGLSKESLKKHVAV